MKYTIDSDGFLAKIDLEPKDHLGYHNVPLARALLTANTHTHRQSVIGASNQSVQLEWDDARKLPVAVLRINPNDLEFKEKLNTAQNEAQRQLGRDVTELIRLRESLAMIKSAEGF